ncbi:hypothetical protein AALP_AA6G352500 [Arabis alpina]|uniref:Bifunctional inhibitor/plant lipid transfer protein/seed storage helical domain-containing protein n=1 Tax=Arabis alpina TaxID=50452 RepID=A0A087GTR6_ARAAL|nr:hypothetical protein AALP_AA6G352500 [Arabis alpina]
MKKFTTSVFIALVIVVMSSPVPIRATVLGEASGGEMAQQCNPLELFPCYTAVTTGVPPTTDCCAKLNEQKPCLCGYIQNPVFMVYVTSPNARKTLEACNVMYPTC